MHSCRHCFRRKSCSQYYLSATSHGSCCPVALNKCLLSYNDVDGVQLSKRISVTLNYSSIRKWDVVSCRRPLSILEFEFVVESQNMDYNFGEYLVSMQCSFCRVINRETEQARCTCSVSCVRFLFTAFMTKSKPLASLQQYGSPNVKCSTPWRLDSNHGTGKPPLVSYTCSSLKASLFCAHGLAPVPSRWSRSDK